MEEELALCIPRDVERGTEGIELPTEEVRRSFDPSGLTFMPSDSHGSLVLCVGGAETVRTFHAGEHGWRRNVATLLEERVTQGELTASPVMSSLRYPASARARAGRVVGGK